ncbi:phage tail tip lysozyme [Sphingomonas sp. S-NIH.Pt15_0812]|uniref:phage tail tip lysozyme n=1 Tax=Sphingomonas sp. S-NIH.Pt15_0812 TaxID=1920129 RepID=UPI000F7DD0DE|nr:phage tail tip lysozyme [Sphingomonas sp. S-NIH.Pt15_0812]RSU46346.1 hypothetical protein BRX43_15915 [Sphingomonas sp. S-NIH.Pt15_0812]
MTSPKVAIDITADDKTAKGSKAAEKRLGAIPKHVSEVNRRQVAEDERRLGRSARAVGRTFGAVEQAAARALGGRSITMGLVSRIGEVRGVIGALGTGMGEASVAGGMLGSTLGVVGVAAAGIAGVMAAAAYGAFRLADGWAKGAAAMGHTAEMMGIATRKLQEFTAAGERVGIDKAAGAGALGGLNQTLNDARYGRNTDAVALLARMGVGLKLKQDGTVDTAAMLPAIADAITRQNSSGRRTAARMLGIGEAALPIFTQGGKALGADMADAGRHAGLITDRDVETGKRIVRKGAMVSQMKDRVMLDAGATAAGVTEQGYDAVLSGGRAMLDGSKDFTRTVRDTFRPAADTLARAADRIGRTVEAGGAGRFNPRQIQSLAAMAVPLVHEAMRYGFSKAEGIGIASNIVLESGGDHRSRERGGNGRGLIQWTDAARKAEFRRVTGMDVEHADRDTQWRFLRYELGHKERGNWRRALAGGQDGASIADGYARHVLRPLHAGRDGAERAEVGKALEIHLKVDGLPKGTSVRASGGRGVRPAVSHAFAQ